VCTMFNGSPFNVRCSGSEAEVEGRCVQRPNCDSATQLEIDGRCVVPQATGAFVLDELRVDAFKPADGVDVPSAPPYKLTMTPADRFSVSWSHAGDGETNATWLSISEASRKDNAFVFHVKIDPTGLDDSFRLAETITFTSATATAAAAKKASVRVKVTQLKIDSVVVAVPSLSRSTIALRVDNRDANTGEPVEVAPGKNVQLDNC
jgi:hypothetical protein